MMRTHPGKNKKKQMGAADVKRLYYNGRILTMDSAVCEAILCEEGVISAAGDYASLCLLADADTVLVNLDGGMLLPAFACTQGSFLARVMRKTKADLAFADHVQAAVDALSAYAKFVRAGAGMWILGDGYDNNKLSFPLTGRLLDEAFPEHPVMVSHIGGRAGILNTTAVMMLGLPPSRKDGYYEDAVYFDAVKRVPSPGIMEVCAAFRQTCTEFFSYGIASACEDFFTKDMGKIYKNAVSAIVDMPEIYVFAETKSIAEIRREFDEIHRLTNKIRICGTKFMPEERHMAPLSPLCLVQDIMRKDGTVGLTDALRAVTVQGAERFGVLAESGTVTVGKRENFAVLDRDIMDVPVDELDKINTVMTVIDGKTVFEA